MFERGRTTIRNSQLPGITISFVLHIAILLPFLHRPAAQFVKQQSVRWGNGEKSYRVLYWTPVAPEHTSRTEDEPKLAMTPKLAKPRVRTPVKQAVAKQRNISEEGDVSDKSVRAGSPFGSLLEGPLKGHDVRPAYPVVFPDPDIIRSQLPPHIVGEVVVEVTIDEQGNVVETKLLKGVGHGIDEKVVAALQRWRYHPAKVDGRPVASKHDVRFQFPS